MYTITKVNNLTHELTILCDGERISLIIPETHNTTSELKKEYIEFYLAAYKLAKSAPKPQPELSHIEKLKAAVSPAKLLPYAPYLLAASILEAIVILVLVLKGR